MTIVLFAIDVVKMLIEDILRKVGEGILPPPPPPPPPGDGDGDGDGGYATDLDATLPFEWENLSFDWEGDKLWE